MKEKQQCYISPPEVNHTNYAYIIGRKNGKDAARTVNESSSGAPTRTEAEKGFGRFRKRKKESVGYRRLMEDMDGNGGERDFWDGAKEGFMKEIKYDEKSEFPKESDDEGGKVDERSGRKVLQD